MKLNYYVNKLPTFLSNAKSCKQASIAMGCTEVKFDNTMSAIERITEAALEGEPTREKVSESLKQIIEILVNLTEEQKQRTSASMLVIRNEYIYLYRMLCRDDEPV